VATATDATKGLSVKTDDLLAGLVERAGSPRADSVARKIILGLPEQPVVSAETAAARHDVTPTAARGALNRLEETGVLVTTRVGRRRNREWISDELFQVLDAFGNEIGQQPDRNDPGPPPRPARPPRI
jgi:hypothetical protein